MLVGATDVLRARLAVAALLVTSVAAMGIVPRLVLYGQDALPMSALRLARVALVVAILAGSSARGRARPAAALRLGGALVLAVGAGAALLEWWLEARAPGAVFPSVLYRGPPSLRSLLVISLTDNVLWVGLWTLGFVYPLTLREAREHVLRAERFRRATELSHLRSRLEPAGVRAALDAISARIPHDPDGARELLSAFASQLDAPSPPAAHAQPSPRGEPDPSDTIEVSSTSVAASVPTPSLREPEARRHFLLALAAVGLLVTAGVTVRLLEHGLGSLPLELVSSTRIAVELTLFIALAERGAARGRAMGDTAARSLVVMFAVGAGFAFLRLWVESSFPGVLYPREVFTHPTPAGRQLFQAVSTAVIDAGFLTLVYLHPLALAEARRRARRVSELQREAALVRLRAGLAPHFVRNALNVIAGLVREDPEEARRLILRLGVLLATVGAEEPTHTLAEEFAWLRAYGDLLEARHPDRLAFRFDADARAEGVRVPRLLLQPLVENAVLHGALAREGGGRVRVASELLHATEGTPRARCVVEDDGPGLRDPPGAPGLGLRLVRERLAWEVSNGDLSLTSDGAGTRAVVELDAGGTGR